MSEFNNTALNLPITKADLNVYLYFEQFQKPWRDKLHFFPSQLVFPRMSLLVKMKRCKPPTRIGAKRPQNQPCL
ncbi:putative membrane protein [Fusarium oxysporum f. sp. albedinis]|nr:putative membrane protein [Fusarium oxysporum f. sp. albedinis]